MTKRALLVQSYDAVADLLTDVLAGLDYEADVITTGDFNEDHLRTGGYRCVFVNLDQNRPNRREHGLKLAEVAASLGVPVIMIPDHETADETIAAHGWLRLRKPFTAQSLEDTIAKQSDSNQIAT